MPHIPPLELVVRKLNTSPFSQDELDRMPDKIRRRIILDRREKVVGEETLVKVSGGDLNGLSRKLIELCERYHPAPIVVVDTDQFRESFLVGMWYRKKDSTSINEHVIYRPGDRAKVLEKQRQLLVSAGINPREDLYTLVTEKIQEAYKLRHASPWEYVKEEVVKKYPNARRYVEEYIPPVRTDIRIALADPKSTIVCRIIGKDWLNVMNASFYYLEYHKIDDQVDHISNEIFDI